MNDILKKGSILHIPELIDYSGDSIVSKQILKSSAGNITLFSFDKGQGLSEHTAPFDAMVQVLDGTVQISIGGTPFILQEGEAIIMPANVPHALLAVDKFKMLLTMIRG